MEALRWDQFVAAAVYTVLGLAIFVVAFVLVDKWTPYQLWKEIIEKQNRALAIIIGAVSIAIAIIIAAAIGG